MLLYNKVTKLLCLLNVKFTFNIFHNMRRDKIFKNFKKI